MDVWDQLLLACGAYVAVVSLVRLMNRFRHQLIDAWKERAKAQRSSPPADRSADQSSDQAA